MTADESATPDQPSRTSPSQATTLRLITPNDPPELSPAAARALLRLLRNVHATRQQTTTRPDQGPRA